MRTTIDGAGRLVLPKSERDRMGLRGGDSVDLTADGEGLRLSPVHDKPRLVREGNVLVFAAGELDRATDNVVQEHRDARIAELVRKAMS